MLSRLVLFAALALVYLATAFPLSDLLTVPPDKLSFFGTQLVSLRDGTYLALVSYDIPLAPRALNPRVRTIPPLGPRPEAPQLPTHLVARVRPTNNSVIWAYAINEFRYDPSAAVDDARSIFVVGDSGYFTSETDPGIRVFRFSVDGEFAWRELYTYKDLGRPDDDFEIINAFAKGPYVNLAGPRTLAIVGATGSELAALGRSAIFVDTVTRKAREVRLSLPDRRREGAQSASGAADRASGIACFADAISSQSAFLVQRLVVRCVNVEGGGEVVSRVLVPFQATNTNILPLVIMAGRSEGKAAVLYVVAIRTIMILDDISMGPEKSANVEEMLLFKLDSATLQDVEWETGLISTKSTMRKLLLTTPSIGAENRVTSLEYIPDRNDLVVLFESFTVLYGIETLPDGTIAFLGNSSAAAERFPTRKWLLFFGNDPEPAAVRIPDDPRPDGEQNDLGFLNIADIELSEDRRSLYLLGRFEDPEQNRYGGPTLFPFPLPEFAQPGFGSFGMGDGVGDGVDESFEPRPNETAEAMLDEEVEPSPNSLQDQDT